MIRAKMCLPRFIGVADIANVRFSLPAQLIEPIPNLGEARLHTASGQHGGLTVSRVLALHRSARDLCEVRQHHVHTIALADTTSIGKSDDELGRMLELLRFWFTKDLVWTPLPLKQGYN